MSSVLSLDQRQAFENNGYILARALSDSEETGLLRSAMEADPQIKTHFYDRNAAAEVCCWITQETAFIAA
jgi:hypothetical protein